MSPSISGADLRYIQQRYLDTEFDDLIFDAEDFPEEAEDDESSPLICNKEVHEK